jgi:hypothetical protein
LNRQLAGIGDVRAGRPHMLILYRSTEGELYIEYVRLRLAQVSPLLVPKHRGGA